MAYITNNHEVWAVCPDCGTEYDRRVWGSECPECARRKMSNIKNSRNGNNRTDKRGSEAV
ncbi:MAG: hypothetical protein IJK92_01470 [Bacteroidales bacterium]|nr:hypothetical protein [Bacteroidales bacterium]